MTPVTEPPLLTTAEALSAFLAACRAEREAILAGSEPVRVGVSNAGAWGTGEQAKVIGAERWNA